MRRYLGTLLLGAFLMTPAAMIADEHHDKRYYDPYRHDYHEWNEAEQRAYRHWMEEERHERYRDYNRASRREQREYWQWRHEHPDWH